MEPDESETDDKTNICPICRRGFKKLTGLKLHWSKSHSAVELKAAVDGNSESINQPPNPESTPQRNCIQIIRNGTDLGIIYQKFDIIENIGAGECLFSSVLQFLRNNVFNVVPKDTIELLRMTVNYILSLSSDGLQLNFDRFRDSIFVNLHIHIPEFASMLEQNDSDEVAQTAYFNYMSSHGVCGTATELCAMSELFGFEFYVIQQTNSTDFSCFDYGSEYSNNGNTLFLFFTGNPDTGHFRLLTTANAASRTAIPPGKYKLVNNYTSSRITSIASISDFADSPVEQSIDNQSTSTEAPQSLSDTSLEEFLVILSRCKRYVKVIKRIPRAARISAARKLSDYIKKFLSHPDIDKNWQNLLTFAYTALQVPTRSKKFSLTKLVKNNIEKGELVIPKPTRKYVPISIFRRVEYKISDGDVKGAVKLLSSTDTIAPFNEVTLEELKQKHPPPTEDIPLPEPPDKKIEPLAVSEKEVYKMIGKFPHGSSAGIDGILPQHLKDLTSPITGEAGLILLRAITKLSNFMLAGKIPSSLCAIAMCAKQEGRWNKAHCSW